MISTQPVFNDANDLPQVKRASTIFPTTGLVRLSQILTPNGPIPVGKSTWWQGVKCGRFPQPTKLGKRITVWRAEDILALVNRRDSR